MDKEILNMDEAAELFGVSAKTFIKLLKEEKVPARKIGREWRFSRKALIDWLSSGDSQIYSSSEGEVKEFFNKVAPEWEEMRKGYYDESVKNKIIELDILNKSLTVVDLGAGNGYLSIGIAGFVKRVIAVDISSEMLRELDKRASESGIGNIEAVESDGQDMPVDDSSIDIVCSNMYLHHIPEPELAISEMFRIVKPGGMVFLADLYEHNNLELKEKMHDIWPGFKTGELRKWFKNCGFKKINIETISETADVRQNKDKIDILVLTAVK